MSGGDSQRRLLAVGGAEELLDGQLGPHSEDPADG